MSRRVEVATIKKLENNCYMHCRKKKNGIIDSITSLESYGKLETTTTWYSLGDYITYHNLINRALEASITIV